MEFFSADTGSALIYSVFEVVYDDFNNTIDTNIYQLKEKNESEFRDNLGRKSIRIERSVRSGDTSKWEYLNTWYASSDERTAERVEENKRYIKLSFPISEEAVWNSNALNMEYVNNVYYGLIRVPFKMDTFNFKNVISVESNTIITGSKERAFKEIYASGIGLVYRNYVFIDTDISGKIKRGIRINQKLISYEP